MSNNMTPREIVEALNKYIVGQNEAKRAVAIALRNRYRRSQLPVEMQEEITPKNILMILCTVVAMVVIMFVAILFSTLLIKLVSFIFAIFTEVAKRISA